MRIILTEYFRVTEATIEEEVALEDMDSRFHIRGVAVVADKLEYTMEDLRVTAVFVAKDESNT